MKKKIIIGILIAALVAGGSAGGAVYYKKSHQKTVSVVSVAETRRLSLNPGITITGGMGRGLRGSVTSGTVIRRLLCSQT